jgi:DNA polymerase-3 subunit gamma/tau
MSISSPTRALARTYRPQQFADLVGQEALVQTLTNGFALNRLAQAYLLTGIRGVGKTTTARIIARALNCIGADGNGGPTIAPCGTCRQCTAIAASNHPDVMEMDAASHTGVADIREILDGVRYAPVMARQKVYIIDEVHMLSTNAFNALLKTLEEPPAHVTFIFATTELRKIPLTIVSRCQRFDLRRVPTAVVADLLGKIIAQEGAKSTPEALHLLAEMGEGSVRDSLTLCDQALTYTSLAKQEQMTEMAVREMLGLPVHGTLLGLLADLLGGKTQAALTRCSELHQLGQDPYLMLETLGEFIHHLTMLVVTPKTVRPVTFSEEEYVVLQRLAPSLNVPILSRFWQILLKGMEEVKRSYHPLQAMEMVLVRLAYLHDLPTIEQIQAPEIKKEVAPAVIEEEREETASSPLPAFTNYQELVALFTREKEMLLAHHLRDDLALVNLDIAARELVLEAVASVPENVVQRMGQCLSKWTQATWAVRLSGENRGASTLAAQATAAKQAAHEELKQHPLVQEVLQAFPGATAYPFEA